MAFEEVEADHERELEQELKLEHVAIQEFGEFALFQDDLSLS